MFPTSFHYSFYSLNRSCRGEGYKQGEQKAPPLQGKPASAPAFPFARVLPIALRATPAAAALDLFLWQKHHCLCDRSEWTEARASAALPPISLPSSATEKVKGRALDLQTLRPEQQRAAAPAANAAEEKEPPPPTHPLHPTPPRSAVTVSCHGPAQPRPGPCRLGPRRGRSPARPFGPAGPAPGLTRSGRGAAGEPVPPHPVGLRGAGRGRDPVQPLRLLDAR